jgi:hypothetical protein
VPFIAAVILASIERTPLNDFATWRSLEGRLAEVLGRQASLPTATGQTPIAVPVTVQAVSAQSVAPVQSPTELTP